MISIQSWHLVPYESFGPIQLTEEIERWDLEDALGTPSREEKGKDNEIVFVFETAEGEVRAIFTPNLEFHFFVLPQNIKLTVEIEDELIQLPADSEELKSYLSANDPDSREYDFYHGTNLAYPKYGLSWDLDADRLCLYALNWKLQLMPPLVLPEVEPLSEKEFKKAWKEIKNSAPSIDQVSLDPVFTKKPSEAIPYTQYGGTPLLKRDEPWPSCKSCSSPLALIYQVDLQKLPPSVRKTITRSGIFQVFHCLKDSCLNRLGESDDDDNYAYLCRIEPRSTMVQTKEKKAVLEKRAIKAWKRQEDGPNYPDILSLNKLETLSSKLSSLVADAAFLAAYEEKYPVQSDKIAGSPSWIQSDETPYCSRCPRDRGLMKFLMQFNSGKEESELVFGDAGCAYVFQCSEHPDTFALIMQTS